jgi:hypothetical protein
MGVTIVEPPEPETSPSPHVRHDVALWAALAAFFGSLLAIGIFDIINPDQLAEYLGAFVVAAITGGAVYSKERLDVAKREEQPPE